MSSQTRLNKDWNYENGLDKKSTKEITLHWNRLIQNAVLPFKKYWYFDQLPRQKKNNQADNKTYITDCNNIGPYYRLSNTGDFPII